MGHWSKPRGVRETSVSILEPLVAHSVAYNIEEGKYVLVGEVQLGNTPGTKQNNLYSHGFYDSRNGAHHVERPLPVLDARGLGPRHSLLTKMGKGLARGNMPLGAHLCSFLPP